MLDPASIAEAMTAINRLQMTLRPVLDVGNAGAVNVDLERLWCDLYDARREAAIASGSVEESVS